MLFDELADQPRALRELAGFYRSHPELLQFPPAGRWLFTGMGASYHAAAIGAIYFRACEVNATAVETVDLFHYAPPASACDQGTVYISQSGSSGEVGPFLDWYRNCANLIGMTNHLDSDLGKRAGKILPMCAGEETLIAAKTYINSLAILWLMARRASTCWDGQEYQRIEQVADRAEEVFAHALEIRSLFNAFYDPTQPLLFLGHGPHAYTARQAAMGMSEWAKVPAHHAGIGAFRHGFIESVRPGQRIVLFSPPGRTRTSALALSSELCGYGAEVMLIENGFLREPGEASRGEEVDEMLSPLLDILPVQIAADGLTKLLGIEPGFRFISKIVRQV